ncbi:MAG: translocation/assembly module TamB domain-containing protein, partial [Bacteroidales bacterium]
VNLSSAENNLTANGYFVTEGKDQSMNINVDIQSLSMKTVQAFSMGTITDATGNLTGNFLIEGKRTKPVITGKLLFENTFITPTALNNPLQLQHETLELKKDGIYLNSFTILDANQQAAVIDGSVQMEQFKNFIFAINVNTKDFLLLNTTAKDNKELHGKMIIDSKIDIKGPLNLPEINARLKLKKGSNFTFAVPEKRLTADKGEGVVEFSSSLEENDILYTKKEIQQSGLTGFDISSIIELDKQATIRLLLDPSTADSLVVKGEAALSFGIDRSGKMSLTGAYHLNEGSYLVTLESIIKRNFDIKPGGSIQWNGDPLNAEVSLDATYSVRASPIDLVADQMSGMSETDKNAYRQEYPFVVLLKLRGMILEPEISFEIQLAPENKGVLGGAVNAKLNMLNEDPSALNKQVFALLVLGRFVQENPLQTEANVASTIVRTTVGKFLSQQLNQFSSKVVPGVDLNFDIQSYDDYQSGQAEGRTQLDIGVKKQLFNERLTVQVGGTIDVEGEKAEQNTTDNFTSDFTVEYELTKDGRYRLKGFRHNQYEGAIEGQVIETGIGILYVRDFNQWKEFFKNPTIKSEPSNNKKE